MTMNKQITVSLTTTILSSAFSVSLFFVHIAHLHYLYRLWTLEREGIVLNMPRTVKGNPSTDLEILLFVSQKEFYFLCVCVCVCVCVLMCCRGDVGRA